MAIRKHKPTTPARRFATWLEREDLTRSKPEKSLVEGKSKSGGRNAHGRVTSRHRGGGAKRRYRRIDFKRRKDGVPAKVAAIEYDPNRSAHIALLHYRDGEKRYILAAQRMTVGMEVMSGDNADIQVGNSLPLARVPTGTVVHNVEMTPGRGGQLGRSAGAAIQLVAKEGRTATLRLPSGEMRMVPAECRATIGTIGGAKAASVGLVTEAVPRARLRDRTREIAKKLLEKNPTALRTAKVAFKLSSEMTWEQAADYLTAKSDQMILVDPERGREQGMKQFLDDKSYRPGLGAYRRDK